MMVSIVFGGLLGLAVTLLARGPKQWLGFLCLAICADFAFCALLTLAGAL